MVAVVVGGRLLHTVVFISCRGIVAVRGIGIIIVIASCADWSAARIHLITRCQKGNFSMHAATVW